MHNLIFDIKPCISEYIFNSANDHRTSAFKLGEKPNRNSAKAELESWNARILIREIEKFSIGSFFPLPFSIIFYSDLGKAIRRFFYNVITFSTFEVPRIWIITKFIDIKSPSTSLGFFFESRCGDDEAV